MNVTFTDEELAFRDEVRARWDKLATAEAEIVADLEWGPRIH